MSRFSFRVGRRPAWRLAPLLFGLIWAPGARAAPFQYTYDAAGRLVRVVDPSGIVVEYLYDSDGNLLEVRRAGGALALLDFTPRAGGPGDPITLLGSGFDPAGTSVSFHGTPATVVSVTATAVVATVPAGATTGPITVTTSKGTVTTNDSFVVGRVTVAPAGRIIVPGSSLQFTAVLPPGLAPDVTWRVDGIVGGGSGVGTITAGGLYTAPKGSVLVTLRATSVASPALFGEARVLVDPARGDSDGDGWPDAAEREAGSDPFDPNSTPPLLASGRPVVSVLALGSEQVNGLPAGSIVAGHPRVSVVAIGSDEVNGLPVGSVVVGKPALYLLALGSAQFGGLPAGSIVSAHPPVAVIVLGTDASNDGPAAGTVVGRPSISIRIASGLAALPQRRPDVRLGLGMRGRATYPSPLRRRTPDPLERTPR